MKVQMIAATRLQANYRGFVFGADDVDLEIENGTGYILNGSNDADELAEFAGRACYQSWSRPNPKTAENEGYLANILGHKHFSVLEHASVTFYITGVSRSLTHELVRHRHLSFSQVSQRYVDESEPTLILPPAIANWGNSDVVDIIEMVRDETAAAYRRIVQKMGDRVGSRKEARQVARAVLPNATETKIVVTGNLRAWRDVIEKRNSEHADREIQLLAKEILRQLKGYAPNTFQDMESQNEDLFLQEFKP